MRFIPVRELRSNCAKIWKQLPKEGPMVVTSHGKPVAIMNPMSEETFEEVLAANRREKALKALAAIRGHAKKRGLDKLTMEEIDAIIHDTRRQMRSEA